jgi:hypothetical protein
MPRLISWISLGLVVDLVGASILTAQEKVAEPAAEESPAKAKFVPAANIRLDAAKTVRLAKLLENLYVLNELNVSDDVYAQLNEVQQQERAESSRLTDELMHKSQADRRLPFAKLAEKTRSFFPAYKARKSAMEESFAFQRFGLLTGPQLVRLEQIDFQDHGLDVFLADDVIKTLQLTTDERRKLDEIYDTYVAKIKPLLYLSLYTEVKAVRSIRPEVVALIQERAAKTNELLGKERVEKLTELRGKTFDVSRLEPFGGFATRGPITPPATARLLDLIQYEAVRKDLKLTPEEEAAIAAARAKAEKSGAELERMATEVLPGKELSEVQRALRTQEVANDYQRIHIRQNYQTELGKVLKISHLKRLEQIDLQYWRRLRPFIALPGIPNELDLTAEQLTKLSAIESDFHTKRLGGGFEGFDASPEEVKKEIERRRKLKKQEEIQVLEVLNAEQRQKLKELQGPPFDVSIFDAPATLPIPLAK